MKSYIGVTACNYCPMEAPVIGLSEYERAWLRRDLLRVGKSEQETARYIATADRLAALFPLRNDSQMVQTIEGRAQLYGVPARSPEAS